MATKKKTTTKKTVAKKEIAYRSVGRNVLLKIDGEKYSKAFKLKSDREAIQAKVEAYNKRNSLKKEKEIIEIMQSGKLTEEGRVTKAKEKVKNQIKTKSKTAATKTTKKVTKAELEAAKKLLEANEYKVTPKTAPVSRRRSGEY